MATTNSGGEDNVTLRIVVLAHGNRAEDDLYLVLGLDTSVGQLKQRIRENLPQHPSPELQRLIYHGRPLLDSNTPLRQVLRLDQRSASPSHVLHLVVRDDNHPNPPDLPPAQHAPSLPPLQATPTQPLPQQPHGHLHNLDHTMLHNQLHNIQHQLHHAQAMTRANQLRLHAQAQAQAQAQHARLQAQRPHSHDPPSNPPQMPQSSSPQPPVGAPRVEERLGPNGEHIRTTTTNNGTATPGSSPSATSDPAIRSANAIPPNIQIHAHPPIIPHVQHMPLGFPFPGLMPQPMYNPTMAASANTSQAQTMAWLLSSPQGPQGIVFAPGHGFFTSLPAVTNLPSQLRRQDNQPQPTPTPTLPTTTSQQTPAPGLQGAQLVIRPQDGTAEIRRPDQPPPPQPGARPHPPAPAPANQPQPAVRQAHQARNNEENAFLNLLLVRGWLFLRLYMFVFVLSESGTWRRIFMLGFAIIFCLLPRQNPFTDAFQAARRHFDNLIGPPNIPDRAPEQPRQDNGQARNVQGQVQGQNNADANANAITQPGPPSTSGRQQQPPMPTPEEAARRLLAQQNRRSPNPILDRLYRIEQGFVLFFASLIPGLGERHVQAREQARRILEEEERRAREERERAEPVQPGHPSQEQAAAGEGGEGGESKTQRGPLPTSWGSESSATAADGDASLSGIDRNAGGDEEGIRARHTGAS
ncbi:hypothetical protein LTR24_006161 [Lithohypha guttulata]|uniref:Ubiquitin-like domain-containing protein n=1 Tax=Lithohypha guttulata TaxID=1690604 RepID=A0ABR0K7S6_9EURO|nr:hypothetical protein LTR24_006161 [Lithohypha guttulata]